MQSTLPDTYSCGLVVSSSADLCGCSDKRRSLENGPIDLHSFSVMTYASVGPTRRLQNEVS